MRKFRFCVLVLLLGNAQLLRGVEKYAITKASDLIVVGALRNVWTLPWRDGWHISGTIAVKTVVHGHIEKGSDLKFTFVCSCCPKWPRPDAGVIANKSGIWFLRRASGGAWKSAGSCFDPGYRPLSELDSFQKELQKYPKSLPNP